MGNFHRFASMAVILTVAACAPYSVVSVAPTPAYEAAVVYRDGFPTVLVDGTYVFVEFDRDLGWGYHDRYRHWFGVSPRFRADLNHRYPEGIGLMRSPQIVRDKPAVVARPQPVQRSAPVHPEPGHAAIPPPAHLFAQPACGEHSAPRC